MADSTISDRPEAGAVNGSDNRNRQRLNLHISVVASTRQRFRPARFGSDLSCVDISALNKVICFG